MPIVQQRRGTAASLQSVTLAAGQIAYETDTGKVKVGDGTTVYSLLEYITDASNIDDGSISTAKIADAGVTTAKLADSSVTTAKIADDAVTSAKVPDGSISTAKLADDGVTSAKIAASAVTNAEIAANTILTGNIASQAVNTQSITDNAVSTAKLADDAVTFAKMQDVSANALLGTGQTAGEITQIVCRQIGRDILDDNTAADVRTTIGAQVAGTYATPSDITTAINDLIDSAPGALDTLNELAAAINDDASFSTTVTNSIATKMPLAGGTFTGSTLHSGPAIDGAYYIGDRIIGGGLKTIYDDPSGVNRAKIREVERANNFSVRVGSVSNTDPNTSQTNYVSPHNEVHYTWNGSAWVTTTAVGKNWIGHYDLDPLIRWTSVSSNETGEETEFDRIQLYDSGTAIAGMGVSPSNFNIGTKGAINVSIYAAGVLNERKLGTLSRHYVDQFLNGKLYTSGGSASAPIISREGDSNTGIYYPAADTLGLVAGGVEFLRGDSTSPTTVVSSSYLIDTTNFIYANGYRAKNNGSKTATAYGKHGQGDTGMYFPANDEVGISAADKDRVKFDEDRTTFYREAGQPTIKADNGNSGYMIIDSASVGSYLSLNHYTSDDILLCYTLNGSGNVIIGASTTTSPNPDNRKLLVEGDTETKGITYSDRYKLTLLVVRKTQRLRLLILTGLMELAGTHHQLWSTEAIVLAMVSQSLRHTITLQSLVTSHTLVTVGRLYTTVVQQHF